MRARSPSSTLFPYTTLFRSRILIVEDEAGLSTTLKDRLQKEGYAVSTARDGNSGMEAATREPDRKSTRLNSSHTVISYAVFCLKKKKHDSGKKRLGCAFHKP